MVTMLTAYCGIKTSSMLSTLCTCVLLMVHTVIACQYWGADKSLARPTSQSISFDASLVIYINSINIPPIMIINRIYETQNFLSL